MFKDGPLGADPDARIGYCTAKKLAYVGYKTHLLCTVKDMTVLNFIITPANVHDSRIFIPLFSNSKETLFFSNISAVYGDNAYNSEKNRVFLENSNVRVLFHTKEETGKEPKNPKSAKRKSKKRSRIEVLFGISQENLGFGSGKVRRLSNVKIDTAIIFSGWNLGSLYSYFVNKIEDRISLKKLLYKK